MILKEIYVTMCKHRHRLVSNGVANEPMGQCSLDECIKYRGQRGWRVSCKQGQQQRSHVTKLCHLEFHHKQLSLMT